MAGKGMDRMANPEKTPETVAMGRKPANKPPLTRKQVQETVERVYYKIRGALENIDSHAKGRFDDAVDECVKGERHHRRMGARFTHGTAKYTGTAEYAAHGMMIRSFLQGGSPIGLRTDHMLVKSARIEYRRTIKRRKATPPAWTEITPAERRICLAWDYVVECCR